MVNIGLWFEPELQGGAMLIILLLSLAACFGSESQTVAEARQVTGSASSQLSLPSDLTTARLVVSEFLLQPLCRAVSCPL